MTQIHTGDIMLTFPSQLEYVHMVTMVATNAASIAGFDKSIAGKVAIATDEAVTNVIKHAYQGEPNREITFRAEITAESLIIKIMHTGRALTKDAIKLPDMEEYMKIKKPGGLGLYIINQFMDEVDYLTGKQHCCQMTKYRKTPPTDKKSAKKSRN